MSSRILVIDDDPDICLLLQRFLTKKGFETTTHHKGVRGIAAYKSGSFDAVICDYRLGDMDALRVINEIREINPAAAIIVITGYSDTRTAVEVMKLGARDYISKPIVPDELMRILQQALSTKEAVLPTAAAAKERATVAAPAKEGIYTSSKSESMQNAYKLINVVAPTNYNVILYGESGTGKEVAARMIHERSLRRDRPFVAVDCGILSRELAASELFGHVKGSFTGALQDRDGHFTMADGGTLFLDEVANLPADVQTTLLRVIQERRFRPVGGSKELPADVRIIVASNESLSEAHQKGKFREDLYYRFNEFMIHLPPLRQRKEDIMPLAELFMRTAMQETGIEVTGFSKEVKSKLKEYRWPGNLRELRNIIRRAVLLTASGSEVNLESFPAEFARPGEEEEEGMLPENFLAMAGNDQITDEELLEPLEAESQHRAAVSHEFDRLKGAANKAEYLAIIQALKLVNFNKKKAAALLKIDRKTLYNKLKNFRMRYSM